MTKHYESVPIGTAGRPNATALPLALQVRLTRMGFVDSKTERPISLKKADELFTFLMNEAYERLAEGRSLKLKGLGTIRRFAKGVTYLELNRAVVLDD